MYVNLRACAHLFTTSIPYSWLRNSYFFLDYQFYNIYEIYFFLLLLDDQNTMKYHGILIIPLLMLLRALLMPQMRARNLVAW